MTVPIKIVCVSLNFQKLDDMALKALSNAYLSNDVEVISNFKQNVGFPIEQFSVIEKCNAVLLVFCYYDDLSSDFIHSRILDTWDKLSRGGIVGSLRHIKFFENIDAIKYLGECSVGLHSVTLGDSQVLSQMCDALQKASIIQSTNPTFSVLVSWLKNLAEEVRLRTELFTGNISLERIAAEIISREIKKEEKVSLVGFGKSGKLIAKILNEELGYHLKIANRTASALNEIKKKDNIEVIDLDNYTELLNSTCVILAVNSNDETQKYSLKLLEHFEKINSKPKLLVDLASPPLIKKGINTNVVTLEDLSVEANKNLNKRTSEVNKARDIVSKYYAVIAENLNREIGKIILNSQKTNVNCKLDNTKLNLFKIRNDSYKSIREYLDKLGFVEVTTPYIVGVSTDPPKVDKGGTIDVSWQGGVKAFLRQSNQLYKQMIVASGLQKIYEIGPFWRAETDQSYRHLQESIGLDIELSNPKNLEELYELAYSIILDVKIRIWKIYKIKNENFILPHFNSVPIITYAEAVNILNSKGYHIIFGEDLGLVGEAKLGQIIKKERNSDAFIVKDYPDSIKKFYTKKTNGGTTETFDIIISGWELVSGAIRETNRSVIENSMRLSGIDITDYNFYLSIVDGSVSHGGFCLGIDRLIAKLLDLEMVSDAVVFPRTFKNLIP